jgi:hypothetical protein
LCSSRLQGSFWVRPCRLITKWWQIHKQLMSNSSFLTPERCRKRHANEPVTQAGHIVDAYKVEPASDLSFCTNGPIMTFQNTRQRWEDSSDSVLLPTAPERRGFLRMWSQKRKIAGGPCCQRTDTDENLIVPMVCGMLLGRKGQPGSPFHLRWPLLL